MGDFSLAEVLRSQLQTAGGDVSRLDTSGSPERIEYIDIGLLDRDPRNRRTLQGLDELAANIELLGLRQPLRVRENPDAPGRYIIVSGHRRRAALQKLVDDGRTDLGRVPCIRERSEGSAALQELRLIFDNLDTQPYSGAEKAKLAAWVEELLYLLKEEGLEFPGRMRDQVAAACKISAPKLARLKVIREKLAPEYMALFEKDMLPEQTAYALARLPQDFQKRLASVLSEAPSGHTAEKLLKKYGEGWRWEPELQCPDGKPCKRGDTFLRRDCESYSWQSFCGGKTCCLECAEAKSGYSPCERMCAKAKARRKAEKDEAEKAAYQRRQKNGRKYQKETQGYARRLLSAIDAAGLAEHEKIYWDYGSYEVAVIRQWAAGEFDDPAEWFSARLVPGKCREAVEMAHLLGCSADFLMGLTNDSRPPAAQALLPQEDTAEESDGTEAEAPAQDVSRLDTILNSEEDPDDGSEKVPARCIRWESRGRTPPVNQPILTYQLTSDGPVYRPAVWDGSQFKTPNGRKVLTGLQYTHWLELPSPSSGEAYRVAPPEEAEGQLAVCGWMPGGTLPGGPCDVAADFRIIGTDGSSDSILRRVCWFDGVDFLFRQQGEKIDAACIRWMVLPPTEDDVSKLDTLGEEPT